ncbi:hypothetical protein H6P81_020451 [Aristolochia fimbriata]|uniref:ARM repeat N-terminal plant domain-containing protein n=1 Tax=Aristolochia fimbriata TaxID=158543 RepID=A0AAV7DVM3_ARIFI|nr:hypothetical protein H6P81_020451 [Aristolochia fimbriata]
MKGGRKSGNRKINYKRVQLQQPCEAASCFFCAMRESDPSLRRPRIAKCFTEMPRRDDEEHVLVLSGLWNIAMTHPSDPEFPSLGVFGCMGRLILRGVTDPDWLARDQNVYIPYYAAHIIGSYTIAKPEFAEKAVAAGVVPPLMELLRGKLSWVEQRVAIRAIGHLASYDRTMESVSEYESEIVDSCMKLAATCLDAVYASFVGAKDRAKQRLKYQCDLLTRGLGGAEMENRKAEEWASQLQCWSIYALNCFASKERSLNLICREGFLKELCEMWGGLVNDASPAGVGLLRILCFSKQGRRSVGDCEVVVRSLCNLARSSDDWQYMGIDCLLLLVQDPGVRIRVLELAAPPLADLVELGDIAGRKNVGDAIARALLLSDFKEPMKLKMGREAEKVLEAVMDVKVARRKKEKGMSEEELQEQRAMACVKKQRGNERFWRGEVEEAAACYSEALELCPVKMAKERVVLYSNRAQCRLILKDAEAAISDATRALCLSSPANSHKKSLWRRSQAYDMVGLAKESLMDCIMYVNGRVFRKGVATKEKQVKVPYYAARMINKQMNATWLFAAARTKEREDESDEDCCRDDGNEKETGISAAPATKKTTGVCSVREEFSSMKGKRRAETPWRRKST